MMAKKGMLISIWSRKQWFSERRVWHIIDWKSSVNFLEHWCIKGIRWSWSNLYICMDEFVTFNSLLSDVKFADIIMYEQMEIRKTNPCTKPIIKVPSKDLPTYTKHIKWKKQRTHRLNSGFSFCQEGLEDLMVSRYLTDGFLPF